MSLFSFNSNRSTKTPKRSFILQHEYNGIHIPVKVSFERRKNLRVAFGQQAVLLRIPYQSSNVSIDKNISWAKQWVNKQLDKNPELQKRYEIKKYQEGDSFSINGQHFILNFEREDRKTVKILIEENKLLITLPLNENEMLINKTIKTALSRFFAKLYIEEVTKRISELNKTYFKARINGVKIKYNKSNWGSCSAKGNINISSRLLFAPKEVQDYVFIHELTHLKELNHSPRFWKMVAQIDPDYKKKEKWLKANSHLLDF